jgi:transmembrane sensor
MNKKETIWIRLARYLSGEMDTREEIAFVREMESDPGKKARMRQMEETWKYFQESHSGGSGDSAGAWDRLHLRLEQDGLLENRAPSPVKRNLPVFRMAASVLIILGLGITAGYFGLTRQGENLKGKSYASEKGVLTVDLPDGSRVYLNEGAEITCASGFSNDRTLELKGEAFFEVMSDPENPFTVNSGKVVISVIGTSFNVRETGGPEEVDVLVESGSVRMALKGSEEFIMLEAGELGKASHSRLTRSALDDPNHIAWKTKEFKFVDIELEDVIHELEESYHVRIHVPELVVQNLRITTTYSQQSIDAILETIGTAFGMTVSKEQDEYYLTP